MPRKKTVATEAKAVEATEIKASEPKTEEIKAEEKAAEPKKAAAKKSTAKTTVAKTAAKKAPAKKAELKSSLSVQYAGRSYTQEDLVKIAKDVWKYDLKRKVGELKSVDLYVKPEENKAYYVMNGEFTGNFDI